MRNLLIQNAFSAGIHGTKKRKCYFHITDGGDSSIQSGNQASDWGGKGSPNGLPMMDQKKSSGWPAISSSSSNGLKPGEVIHAGDVDTMNGNGPEGSLMSSDQKRSSNFSGEGNSLSGSIWGSGSPGWGGIQSSDGPDKPTSVSPSFNPSLQVDGMQSGSSGNPWGQGSSKSPLTSQSNTSMSSVTASSGGMTYTTSSSNAHWSGSNAHGQEKPSQEQESSSLAKIEVSAENTPTSSTSTVTNPGGDAGNTDRDDSNKPTTNTSNVQNQDTEKNGWQGQASGK